MNWQTLSPLEFAAIWSVAAALAVWLYLLHQRARRKRVSTLRFWQSLEASAPSRRPRRIREPWALLAQLLFLLLGVLALANPRWGAESAEPRHLALVVDTSVWAQAQPQGEAPWIEQIRDEASRVIDQLETGDRVLLLRAEADAAPVLPFTVNRAALRRSLATLRPSDTVADLPRALQAAQSALAGKRRATLVYVGPGMIDESQRRRLEDFRRSLGHNGGSPRPPLQLLARRVGGDAPIDNRGITRLALRRDPARPDRWHLLVAVKNYGDGAVRARLKLSVGGHPLQEQALSLAAGETVGARAEFAWAEGGLLLAELDPPDALAADNRARAYLPAFRPVRVAVLTTDPQALSPVLSANPYLRCEFLPPDGRAALPPQVVIHDAGMALGEPLAENSIVFLRGSGAGARQVRLTAWNAQHPVTRWVRTRDISVQSAAQIRPRLSDTVLAWADGAPLILAREEGGRKSVVLGFDPRQSNLPLQPAFPLLLAGAIEWMTGAVEDTSDPVTAGEAALPADGSPVRVYTPAGQEMPFARQGDQLHLLLFYSGLYRVRSAEGERKIAVNIPPLPGDRWRPGGAESAVLEKRGFGSAGSELWRWLLLLAMLPLWAEGWLASPVPGAGMARPPAQPQQPQPPQQEAPA